MWSRKRIDIGWSDLAYGLVACLGGASRSRAERAAEEAWSDEQSLICLSVRSGLDLLLQTAKLPPGSEVLVSAITIPDMVRLLEEQQLVPVPVDIDPQTLSVDLDSLRRNITPRTRAVLVAHLFGSIMPLQPVIDVARQHELLVIEDCAQAFDGCYRGHPQSDVVAFSFGPIKSSTALAGGLLIVRDAGLLAGMRQHQRQYPVQSSLAFAGRIIHYGLLKLIGTRPCYAALVHACRWRQRDLDDWIAGRARNISAGDFPKVLRQQPSLALLKLLRRRLLSYDFARHGQQRRLARRLVDRVSGEISCPGVLATQHSYWVFVIHTSCADRRVGDRWVRRLRQAGFDATTRHSLCVVPPPANSTAVANSASGISSGILFVPVYPEMPEPEIRRLGNLLHTLKEAGGQPSSGDHASRHELSGSR